MDQLGNVLGNGIVIDMNDVKEKGNSLSDFNGKLHDCSENLEVLENSLDNILEKKDDLKKIIAENIVGFNTDDNKANIPIQIAIICQNCKGLGYLKIVEEPETLISCQKCKGRKVIVNE